MGLKSSRAAAELKAPPLSPRPFRGDRAGELSREPLPARLWRFEDDFLKKRAWVKMLLLVNILGVGKGGKMCAQQARA